MQFNSFSKDDVRSLKEGRSEAAKLELVKKLQQNFSLDKLSPNEKLIAEEIIRFLAADISVRIRQSIAENFRDNVDLPYDIALKLANDMEDIVAVPIIENSTVLEEKDLLDILERGTESRLKAVARRANLTENLCAHIIYRTSPEVIGTLINNHKTKISEHNTDVLIRNHSNDQMLMRMMIQNKKVTLEQAHNLLVSVSHDLQKMLIVEYNIPSTVVNNLIYDSKEWMVLNMIISHMSDQSDLPLKDIIDKLYEEKELTFSILVKALSIGNVEFFEAALAKLANASIDSISAIINGSVNNPASFKALYSKCQLPESMSEAIYKLMLIVIEEKYNVHAAKIHHRILNRLSRISNNEKIANLDYLVTIVAYNLKKSNLL